MKISPCFFLHLLLLCFVTEISIAQVGINNTSPNKSAVLDIASSNKGMLIPRVSLESTVDITTIIDASNSLLVFNTATIADVTPGFYYWDTSYPKWVRFITVDPNVGKSVKYSVTDFTTNLNVNANGATGVIAPVFGNNEWNDDSTLFIQSSNQLQVKKDGVYRIVLNAYLVKEHANAIGVGPEMQILINSSRQGTVACSKNTNISNHSYTSLLLIETLRLNTNDIIEIDAKAGGEDNEEGYFVRGTASNGYPSNITITYIEQ